MIPFKLIMFIKAEKLVFYSKSRGITPGGKMGSSQRVYLCGGWFKGKITNLFSCSEVMSLDLQKILIS
jgi:hypothetical protein